MACSFHMGSRRLAKAGRPGGWGRGFSGQWLVRPRRPFFKHGVQSWRVRKTSIGFSGFLDGRVVERVPTYLGYLGLHGFW